MFPDGNDTEVGERYNFRKLKLPDRQRLESVFFRGVLLSGGQRQRICLARSYTKIL